MISRRGKRSRSLNGIIAAASKFIKASNVTIFNIRVFIRDIEQLEELEDRLFDSSIFSFPRLFAIYTVNCF